MAWAEPLKEYFPHRVGRNFGGFSTVLAKPRVDAPPGRSRALLQIWPALGSPIARTDPAPPAARDDCETELDPNGPYSVFLRDVFRSKAHGAACLCTRFGIGLAHFREGALG